MLAHWMAETADFLTHRLHEDIKMTLCPVKSNITTFGTQKNKRSSHHDHLPHHSQLFHYFNHSEHTTYCCAATHIFSLSKLFILLDRSASMLGERSDWHVIVLPVFYDTFQRFDQAWIYILFFQVASAIALKSHIQDDTPKGFPFVLKAHFFSVQSVAKESTASVFITISCLS